MNKITYLSEVIVNQRSFFFVNTVIAELNWTELYTVLFITNKDQPEYINYYN